MKELEPRKVMSLGLHHPVVLIFVFWSSPFRLLRPLAYPSPSALLTSAVDRSRDRLARVAVIVKTVEQFV